MTEEQARVRALQIASKGKYLDGVDGIIKRADKFAKFIMNGIQEKKED